MAPKATAAGSQRTPQLSAVQLLLLLAAPALTVAQFGLDYTTGFAKARH